MVWLLAHCACPCGTDSGAICQPLTLIRLRQSIVSERLSMGWQRGESNARINPSS